MKNLKLEISFSNNQGFYYIPLESGEKINFKTKREANLFLSSYKKYLNDSINSLLYNYSRVHSVFLDYYLQFDSQNSHQLNKINLQILKKIDLVYSDFGKGWRSLIFENLESAYYLIHEFIEYLKKYAQRFKIQNLIHRVNSISLSYFNDFNKHRETQKNIKNNLEYKKSKLLKIAFRNKRLIV